MELKQKLGKDFSSKLNIIEQEAEKLWKKGEFYHVYYVLHGLDHSNSVIEILGKLIDGLNSAEKLNKTEIFCLLSAALLHDVGMLCKYSDDDEKAARKSELKKRPYSVQDLIRDEHHIRSGRYIKEHVKDLQIDHREAECIRLIAEGHRQIKLESNEYDDRPIGLASVRVRLLSALLRLADELDLLPERAPGTLLDILKKDMPDYSRLHWLKHYYTSGLLIKTSEPEKGRKRTSIEIHCQYPIEETLNEVRMILLDYGLRLSLDYKIAINSALEKIPEDIYDKYLGQKLKISMELPRTKGFVGRKDELGDLLSSLDKNVIIIEGIAGIGKSYIAAKFAEKLKDEYTVYWYGNLSEVSTLSSVMNKISIFLKENGKPKLSNSIEHFGYDNEVLIALLKEELNSDNFAIFFDNYHKAEKELNPLLKQLVSITPSKIIIITRQEPEFYNVVDERENRVTKIKVDAWDFTNTKVMLEARGIEATNGTIQEIHGILLGHPQYLNLFCILAERSTAEQLLENLPTALKDAHDYLEKEVYNSLISEEKLLLQTISVFRVSETVDAFDTVNEFKDLKGTLNSLIHKFLLNEIGINTYSVHEIIRDYCLSDVSRRKILRSYHEGAAKYYLSLDEDPEHILEATYHFDEAGMKEESAEVIIDNAGDLITKGFWEKIENRLQSAIKSFRRKTQPHAIYLVARANLEIGDLYVEKGDYDPALLHALQSLNGFRKIKDKTGIFGSNNLIASIYVEKKGLEEAKRYNEKCLKMADKQKDDYWKAVAMGTCGILLGYDDKEKKLDCYLKSLKIFEDKNAVSNITAVCANVANVYAEMGNYEKSYEFIKRALELDKERNAFYGIARKKIILADINYKDPKKPVSVNSIIKFLEEALETYEKIGHVRGTAGVLNKIGNIYRKEEDFKSAVDNYQRAATIYSSLNQQSEEAEVNSKIGVCYTKLKDFTNARSYLEKNLLSGYCGIGDKLSLVEVYLNNGDYTEAFELSNKFTTDDAEEISDDERYLALLFSAIPSVLLKKEKESYNCLKKIGEFDCQKVTIKWDFSDIEPVLDKTGESKQFFIDAIALLKGEANYPIIRLKDIKIIRDEAEKQAEVFHPFTGSLTITKDDENLKEIMQKLSVGGKIDFDTPEIMGMKRDKALLIFGFLFMKGFLDCKNPDKQKFDLKLSERGLKVLGLT
jgi:tetratricopeptide (TPR) repeat protein